MKYFILILLAAVAANAMPASQRYIWMPDGYGVLHLVDLQQEAPQYLQEERLGDDDVKLYLYTRNNPNTAQIIKEASIPSNFNAKDETRFVVHGWTSSAANMDHFRSAYLATGKNYNIVLVDWSGKASAIYTSAKSSTKGVGEYVSRVLSNLVAKAGMDLNKVYLVGHSLGAHIVGIAGYNQNGKVGRVVGLDTAAPLYGTESTANRLDVTDGKFVEGIHTNAGLLGWVDPIGHVDFYPNGGSSQAGCGVDISGSCSHSRSHEFYTESATSNNLKGTKCSDYKTYSSGKCAGNPTAVMGENTPTSASGTYYLDTNKSSPFGQG